MEEQVNVIQIPVSQEINSIKTDVGVVKGEVSNLTMRLVIAENNIQNIDKKLDKIEGNTSKLIWILVLAIVGAVLKLIGLY